MQLKDRVAGSSPDNVDGSLPSSAPPAWRHWWMVVVLGGLTILSFIDRNALYILIDYIKADFGLTDAQSGLLLGAAFAFLYAFAGLPAGYLVDRFSRRHLIMAAVVLWSLMTAFSGLASTFGLLFMGRMGVGLGEAFLSPAAGSLIRNALPLQHRARAFGVINACASVGGGLALVVVGGLAAALPPTGITLPVIGPLSVWQLVLLIVGVIGIPLSLLVLTFPEPPRGQVTASSQPATMSFFFHWLARHRRFYVTIFVTMAVVGIGTYGYATWMPTALARRWGIAPELVGVTYGSIQMAAALTGIAIGANLLHALMKRYPPSVTLAVTATCTAGAALSCILTPIMPTLELSWAMLAFHWLMVPTIAVGTFTALTAATPGASMGKIMAVGYLSHSVAGYGLGPSLVAAVSDRWFEGSLAIGHAISLCSGTALIIGAVGSAIAARFLPATQQDPENR